MIRFSRVTAVTDSSHVGEARRIASQCAQDSGMSEVKVGRVSIVATELATNLIKHGGGGSILFGADEDRSGNLSLVAIDKGEGIANVGSALADGFSTVGTAGTGLGAVRRAAADFAVYSRTGKGTAVLCSIEENDEPGPGRAMPSRMSIAGIAIPLAGETANGDSWVAINGRDVVTVVIADGLGHGGAAASASLQFIRLVKERPELPIEEMIERGHGELRATRGAAVGIARIFPGQSRLDFTGVGNIAATILSDGLHRKTVSLNGIVGHEMRRVQTFSYPWSATSVLVAQSDGISANWNADTYPGLADQDPALIAAVLYRDNCRGSDDATIVVTKAS